jgi:hypothetical protein
MHVKTNYNKAQVRAAARGLKVQTGVTAGSGPGSGRIKFNEFVIK